DRASRVGPLPPPRAYAPTLMNALAHASTGPLPVVGAAPPTGQYSLPTAAPVTGAGDAGPVSLGSMPSAVPGDPAFSDQVGQFDEGFDEYPAVRSRRGLATVLILLIMGGAAARLYTQPGRLPTPLRPPP